MTHQATLAKAIKKAQANGWWSEYDVAYLKDMGWTATVKHREEDLKPGEGYVTTMLSENDIIFNHDFAKALWGEDEAECNEDYPPANWEYHLQGMVIADDPLAYLGANL